MTIWIPELADNNTPKYKRLADAIDSAIQQGTLKAEQKLPPQRLLADALQVTVGTITRAYNESERRGSVVARVGSGTFVKTLKPSHYLSEAVDKDCLDLNSAKAPMGLQREMMSEALMAIAQEQATLESSLAYQPETAMQHQRERLVKWLNKRDLICEETNLLFTYGGQHGLSITLQSICRAGDSILCEGLSFPGISVICQQQQLRCIGLQMDEEGITPESLTAACLQSNPRAIYLTAQMQNPTSVQMSLQRKQEIVAICEKFNLIVLEDDVQFLPQTDKVKSFYELSPTNTVYISSFSKSFSGGLRVGYLVADNKIREDIRISLRASCWTVPTLMIEIVTRWLENGKMDILEAWLTQEMAARNTILKDLMSDYEITSHPHGFNVWLVLPEHWRAIEFAAYAKTKGVLVRPAESYAIGRFPAPQNIRLCISAPQTQVELVEALKLLKKCLAESPQRNELVM